MTKGQRDYLRSLVRMNIRKRERDLEHFKVRPGQSDDEAAKVRAKFERDLAFRREVLADLDHEAQREQEILEGLLAPQERP